MTFPRGTGWIKDTDCTHVKIWAVNDGRCCCVCRRLHETVMTRDQYLTIAKLRPKYHRGCRCIPAGLFGEHLKSHQAVISEAKKTLAVYEEMEREGLIKEGKRTCSCC